MDLILWRHAQAQEHPDPVAGLQGDGPDMGRRLTPRGVLEAARMADWLERRLPENALVYTSPAVRTEQTAMALGRQIHVCPVLAPGADPEALLRLVQWPDGHAPVVVVGHQPTLGAVIAQLLGMKAHGCAVKKGAAWWLRHRVRDGQGQTVLLAVQSPEWL